MSTTHSTTGSKSRNGRIISSGEQLFDRHTPERPTDACWIWRGSVNRGGYGVTRIGGRGAKALLAHRLSWQIHRGTVPLELHVLHRCDTPPCVNPDHLFLGTNADNIVDKVSKNRQAQGEQSGPRLHPEKMLKGESRSARCGLALTSDDIRRIRAMVTSGVKQKTIAEMFNCDPSLVSHVAARRIWRSVE